MAWFLPASEDLASEAGTAYANKLAGNLFGLSKYCESAPARLLFLPLPWLLAAGRCSLLLPLVVALAAVLAVGRCSCF
jgi:hypothetical protein